MSEGSQQHLNRRIQGLHWPSFRPPEPPKPPDPAPPSSATAAETIDARRKKQKRGECTSEADLQVSRSSGYPRPPLEPPDSATAATVVAMAGRSSVFSSVTIWRKGEEAAGRVSQVLGQGFDLMGQAQLIKKRAGSNWKEAQKKDAALTELHNKYRANMAWHKLGQMLDPMVQAQLWEAGIVKGSSIAVNHVSWSPGGKFIAVAFTKHLIHLYAFRALNDLQQHLEIDTHGGRENDLAFSYPNKQLCITVGYASVVFVLRQTSDFDEVYLKREEFGAQGNTPFTVDIVEVVLHMCELEFFNPTWGFLRPLLLKATSSLKFQGRVLETSCPIIEQKSDNNKQSVHRLKEASNKFKQPLILLHATVVDYILQDGHPDCIIKPAQTRILIWVFIEENMEEKGNCYHSSPKQLVLLAWLAKFGIDKTAVAIGNDAHDMGILPRANMGVEINGLRRVQAIMLSNHEDYLLHIHDNEETVGVGHGSDPWNPGGHAYVTSSLSSFFMIWDPGGRPLFFSTIVFLHVHHLEDKVIFLGGEYC